MTTQAARLDRILTQLEQLSGVSLDAATPFAATDAGGYPAHVAAGELIESAWGNAVSDAINRVVRVAEMAPLSSNQALTTTAAYVCLAANITNNRAGSWAVLIGSCGVSTSVAGSAATIKCGVTPPGGGIVQFGPPGIIYEGAAINQMTTPVVGVYQLTQVGNHAFFLVGTSATGNALVPAGSSGGIAVVIGG